MAREIITKCENYWTTDHNFRPEIIEEMGIEMPERVEFQDCTLREGEQTPGVIFTAEEKIEVVKMLDDLGVTQMQIFPAVSPKDEEALKYICTQMPLKNVKMFAMCRVMKVDIDNAAKLGCAVGLEMPCRVDDEAMQRTREAIRYAHSLGLYISAGPGMCGRQPWENMEKIARLCAEEGVDQFACVDTLTHWMPWTVTYLYRQLRKWLGPDVQLYTHFHNDLGMATAKEIAAVCGGATVLHCTLNGLGERAGNAALDELAVNLDMLCGVDTGLDLSQLYPVSRKIADITKVPVSPEKPIVGERMHQTGSGMVVHNWLNAKGTPYENCNCFCFAPQYIGRPSFRFQYGYGTGRAMLGHLLEQKGLVATQAEADEILLKMKEESRVRKAVLSDDVVDRIIHSVIG